MGFCCGSADHTTVADMRMKETKNKEEPAHTLIM